jgi:hypothetical protein
MTNDLPPFLQALLVGGFLVFLFAVFQIIQDSVKAQRDSEKGAEERLFWATQNTLLTLSVTFTAVAGLIATAAFFESKRQADYAQAQLDAIRDEQRPWLTIAVAFDPETDLEKSAPGIVWPGSGNPIYILQLRPFITNVGKSPAADVEISLTAQLVVRPQLKQSEAELMVRSACEAVGHGGRTTIFPGDKPEKYGVVPPQLSAEEVAAYRASVAKAQNVAIDKVLRFRIYAIACAAYRFTGQKAWHYSGRLYLISQTKHISSFGDGAIQIEQTAVPADDLGVELQAYADYFT